MVAPERRRSHRVESAPGEPVQLEIRCGEGRPALRVPAHDVAIHGLGVQLDPADLARLDERLGLDVEFVLPGQADRIGVPVTIRHRRELEGRVHVGLEFAHEDSVQQDWVSSHIAEFVAGRLSRSETLGRAA